MNDKKRTLIHQGARVRVADPREKDPERWQNARPGTVTAPPIASGVQVKIDGDLNPRFVPWTLVDVEKKPRHTWLDIPLASLLPSRWQYRRKWPADGLLELAKSIQEAGLINRLLVFRHEDAEHYELIAGERRARALCALALSETKRANLAGAVEMVAAASWWDEAPTMIQDLDITAACELRDGEAKEFREIVILENLQREDPSPVEEAEAFKVLLKEEGYTQAQLAQKLGKSQGYISQRLSLLGLAGDVRETVESQEISFTAARSLATLPEAVQPAIAGKIQEMAAREGESAATTRKVQAMIGQVRRFLDAERWLPPADRVLFPAVRNRLRLLHFHIERLDPTRAGQAMVDLQDVRIQGAQRNLTGKDPLSIADSDYLTCQALSALDGYDQKYDVWPAWLDAARANGWECHVCRWAGARRPEMMVGVPLCARWITGREGVASCLHYMGSDDPVMLPLLGNDLWNGINRLELVLPEHKGRPYTEDFEQWAQIQEDVALDLQDREARAERAALEAHLPALRSFWEAQGGFDLSHPQAHDCQRCVEFRPDLLEEGQPPCRFTVEPLEGFAYSTKKRAPDMGVLVREDGLVVPRCERFRYAEIPEIAPLEGFVFPEKHQVLVLTWLSEIMRRGSGGYDHSHTLPSGLFWLAYPRPDDRPYDLDALLRYVRGRWHDHELISPTVARLLEIAAAETAAVAKSGEPMTLVNLAGETERWASKEWAFWTGEERR